MATGADNAPDGTAYGYLVTVAVADAMKLLTRAYELASEFVPDVAQDINDVLIGFIRDVNDVAVKATGYAEGFVMRRILETRSSNRPQRGNMESHILSRPGPFGLVEVALLEELDKIVNPNGYGPYWRAQEYGTGSSEVETQMGRILYGTFEPSGTPPQASMQGGKGTDLEFVPGGANPGLGTINREIAGRHFLRDGFAEAGQKYREDMAGVESRWNARIQAVLDSLKSAASSGGGFTGIIEG